MKELKLIDFSFKIEETIESMKNAIDVSKATIKSQAALIKLIESSKLKKTFAKFVEDAKTDNEKKLEGIKIIEERIEYLTNLLLLIKSNGTVAIEMLMLFLYGLGMENPKDNEMLKDAKATKKEA